jgi:hypothetical protein
MPDPRFKLVFSGVPHRTSYELHLPAELPWYSLIELQRTLSGRSEDAAPRSRVRLTEESKDAK